VTKPCRPENSGVAGALLSTFVTPGAATDEDPRYDLDMDSMSLVKSLPGGRHGTAYPDMPWEPKEAFWAVAHHFGHSREPRQSTKSQRVRGILACSGGASGRQGIRAGASGPRWAAHACLFNSLDEATRRPPG